MTDRLVIMFAYHFPPENAIGGARPFRFYKYLNGLGYRCHVLTAADQGSESPHGVQYVPDPFVEREDENLGFHVDRAIRKLLFPGAVGISWSHRAALAARQVIRSNPNAAITVFSTFPPLGTLLAAWRIARLERLPWIADYRDPLTGTSADRELRPYQRVVYNRLERALLLQSSAVIANTDSAVEAWKRKYPGWRDNIHLIWNGFDPERRIGPLPRAGGGRRLLVHAGELYSGRNIAPVLESIRRLIDCGRLTAANIRLQLVGPAESGCLPGPGFIERATQEGWLDFRPRLVPQDEALRMTQTADGLLLVQPQSTVQVPGKLFDYIQIGRPILAYIPRNTPIERILEGSGIPYRCAYAGDTPEHLDAALESFFALDPEPVAPSAWFDSEFDGRRQTETLANLIRNLRR